MSRTVVSISVAALTLALAACGGGGEKATESEAAAPAAEAPAAPAAEAPAAADPAAAPEAAAPAPSAAAPAAAGGAALQLAGLTGDAARGQKLFAQCRTCHVLDEGVNRVGPSLHKIVGRPAGQVAGYNYSAANKNSGLTWNEETLFEYLVNPRQYLPGTKMTYPGMKDAQQRADLIAYLKTDN